MKNSYKPKEMYQKPRLSSENSFDKQSELKYLSNFRKINQTRFYYQCELKQNSFKVKWGNCLNKGEPSSKAKYGIISDS